MAISLILQPDDELMTLVVNSVRNDLLANAPHYAQTLALSFVANLGNKYLAETLSSDVVNILIDPQVPMYTMANNNQIMIPPEIRESNRSLLRKNTYRHA